MVDSSNYHCYGSNARYGLPKARKCLHCRKEIVDDGSPFWLRGFCSDACRLDYLQSVGRK